MNFTNENVIKAKKQYNVILILGILFSVIGIALALYLINKDKNIETFEEAISLEDTYDVRAFINVSKISPSIGSYEDYEAFYLVSDATYMYVVYLPNYIYNEIESMDLSTKSYRLEGRLEVIPSDVENAIIDIYKDSDFEINEDNFYDYFSNYYLNQKTDTYLDDMIGFVIMFGTMGIVLIIIWLILVIRVNHSIRQLSMSEISKLEGEMASSDAIFYKKLKLYLTRNYIIMMDNKFKYYKYEDILWMYLKINKYNQVPVSENIMILATDNKLLTLARATYVGKKSKDTLNEIMNKIIEKNSNIKLGYTKENKKYFKALRKEMKNK